MDSIIFAQTAIPDGFAGWSSFGIVGLVLSWLLLKHLPEQAKTQKEERIDFTAALRDQQAVFSASLQRVVDHCRDEMKEIIDSIHERHSPPK